MFLLRWGGMGRGDKGAARVDACRHGLHGLHAMRVDMHAEACVSTVSGFGWPACWSSVASLGSMRVMRVDPVLTFPSKARFGGLILPPMRVDMVCMTCICVSSGTAGLLIDGA